MTDNNKYWRFAAMIGTSSLIMFILMYFNTFAFEHLRWSETRFCMTFVMGAAMAVGFTLVVTLATRGWKAVCLSQATQRVVVAHVWVEHSLASTSGTAFQ